MHVFPRTRFLEAAEGGSGRLVKNLDWPWPCHGNAMALPWHCHGTATARPWPIQALDESSSPAFCGDISRKTCPGKSKHVIYQKINVFTCFYVLEASEHLFGESERLFELVERLFVFGERCSLPTLEFNEFI